MTTEKQKQKIRQEFAKSGGEATKAKYGVGYFKELVEKRWKKQKTLQA